MAKAKKTPETQPEEGASGAEETKKSSKQMSKKEAQDVLDRYSGINMPGNEPEELATARKVMKQKEG
jgi:hypothetical protein